MENTYTIKFYELNEKEFENNEHLNMRPEVEEFGEGYTIEDFYSDRAGVVLERLNNYDSLEVYSFETDDEEKRYVIVLEVTE